MKIVIKYPNWYEHFQGLGFNLEEEPKYFDGIYTGTETRSAISSDQHLQAYLGYNVFRYYENIKPGGNGGGWVDPFASDHYDRYAEQLWITAFAKAPEITLFDFSHLSQKIMPADRAPWQGQKTSFDFDEMMKPLNYMAEQLPRRRPTPALRDMHLKRSTSFWVNWANPLASKVIGPLMPQVKIFYRIFWDRPVFR